MLLRPGAPLGTAPELWQEGDQMFDAVETLCAVGDDSWAKAPTERGHAHTKAGDFGWWDEVLMGAGGSWLQRERQLSLWGAPEKTPAFLVTCEY